MFTFDSAPFVAAQVRTLESVGLVGIPCVKNWNEIFLYVVLGRVGYGKEERSCFGVCRVRSLGSVNV